MANLTTNLPSIPFNLTVNTSNSPFSAVLRHFGFVAVVSLWPFWSCRVPIVVLLLLRLRVLVVPLLCLGAAMVLLRPCCSLDVILS